MDRHYSEIGGKPINLDKEESEMSDAESMRCVLRFAIRESICRTAATIFSRPFTGDHFFIKSLFKVFKYLESVMMSIRTSQKFQ